MIKYTIVCPNCGKTKTFERERPSSYERRFCSQSCGTQYQMAKPEARLRQSEVAKKLWKDPEFCANRRATPIEYTITCPNCGQTKTFEKQRPSDPDRQFCSRSCASSYRWADPDYKTRLLRIFNSPERTAKLSKSITEKWKDPKYRSQLEGEQIEYTIICPTCRKKCNLTRTPGNSARKFCSRSCANSYTTSERWANPEYKESTILSMIEKWNDPEHRQKMLEILTSPEQSEKIRTSLEEYWSKPEHHEAASQRMKELWETNSEYRETVSAHNKERWEDPEYKEMMITSAIVAANKPGRKEEMSQIAIELWRDPDTRASICKGMKQKWSDNEWAEQQIQRMANGLSRRPTKPELKLFNLLNVNGYRYDYVGDGSLYFGTKNPDFIWQKESKIIEMFGSYWHDKSEVGPRTKHFAEYGYNTLIIWDYELDDTEQLLAKLREFHQG